MNAINLVLQAGVVAKAVLVLLLFFSLASWTIIFLKLRAFGRTDRQDERFLKLFRESKNLSSTYEDCRRYPRSPLAALFREGYRELSNSLKGNPGPAGNPAPVEAPAKGLEVSVDNLLSRVSRTLRHASLREVSGLERALIFLATTGNVTPFIGLFGTVWGIMDAFHSIGLTGSANLGAVAPGIAEALITTAAGLATAIPGVIAYNYFLNRIKGAATRMDLFGLEFVGMAERIIVRASRS
ncbi:MAG TPA: MotA/TolQ/ExbB proton channel family protein [Candidatus Methylomirabilis sp.]|nr:MotA/TolQ/ExbB proton channel family protein [Candidatus Methylomirabilis sp.]